MSLYLWLCLGQLNATTGLTVDGSSQTCTNTRNTSIPHGVLSFKVDFVDKFKLVEDIFLLLFWPYQIKPLPYVRAVFNI